MPLYEYRCTQCGHRFERIQNFSAEPELECPQCKGALERPLTAPALQFKGAGWYVNDYAGKSKTGSSSDASAPTTAAPAAETKSAAAEPAAKPATPAASA